MVMQYATCLTFFVNQDTVPIEYCRSDWVRLLFQPYCFPSIFTGVKQSSLVNFIAPNCQATQNAHGGLCLASNQQWFAQ